MTVSDIWICPSRLQAGGKGKAGALPAGDPVTAAKEALGLYVIKQARASPHVSAAD